jgi:activin receptor type-1
MECCTGDYCNNGSFPILPPIKQEVEDETSQNENLWMILAVLGPVFIIVLLTAAVITYMRKNHKKRLVDARIQQDADTYYASDDLIKRSHACGDSTLRVS